MIARANCEMPAPGASPITVRYIKKGEQVDPISFAGRNMELWSAFGITASVFPSGKTLHVPLIASVSPGSGHLDRFLAAMKEHAGTRRLLFRTVINAGLRRHLEAAGIAYD